ncbi:MAG TPA: hypothetical protein VF629_21515 [Hymenobacter sp.]|jgi:hypothetical protein|uniref:hypothetical protein n=1 Tax=Hymenobacter sp. TaxID=1898978 RepID=UPI002ED7B3AC
MKKTLYSILGMASALLLAGGATQSAATTAPVSSEQTAQSADSTSRTPKQDSPQATSRNSQARAQVNAMSFGGGRHFSDSARPRRVKYGKSRWIVLA